MLDARAMLLLLALMLLMLASVSPFLGNKTLSVGAVKVLTLTMAVSFRQLMPLRSPTQRQKTTTAAASFKKFCRITELLKPS